MNNKRRSLILPAAGFLIGSLLTALLFSLCSNGGDKDQGIKEEPQDKTRNDAAVHTQDIFKDTQVTTRELKGDCVLEGSVHTPDNLPLDGATVGLRLLDEPWATANLNITAETNSDGTFKISGITENAEYQLWAWAPGYAIASYEDVKCGTKTHLSLELGAALSLHFIDSAGNKMGPVNVEIAGSSLWPTRHAISSDESNLFLQGLAPGFFSIRAFAKDHSFSLLEPIELKAGDITELEIQLTRSESAIVMVKDAASGEPLAGATVISKPLNSPLLQSFQVTNAEGKAELPWTSTTGDNISVLLTGYVQQPPKQILSGDKEIFKLHKGAVVRGVITTTENIPIKGAFPKVKLGAIFASIPSGPQRIFQKDIFASSAHGWPNVIPLDSPAALVGPSLLPLPSQQKEKTTSHLSPKWRPTNNAGEFELDGLPAGHFVVGATHAEFILEQPAEITVAQGTVHSGLQIVMRRGNNLAVRILNRSGFPIRDAIITIYNDDMKIIATDESHTDGFTTFSGLPATYRIEAVANGFVPATTKVNASKTAKTDVVLKLPYAGEVLSGRLTDVRGYGVPEASITARAITRGLVQILLTETESDGTFTLEGAGKGSYHVTASINDKVAAQVGDASSNGEIKLVMNPSNDQLLTKNEHIYFPPEATASAFENLQSPTPTTERDTTYRNDDNENPGLGIVAISEIQENQGSVNTAYGPADILVVTGPPSGRGGLPITIRGGPGNVRVKSVMPGSMIAGANLKVGDKIISVDNIPVKSPADARRAIIGKIGSVVIVEVAHKGDRFKIVVQRVRVAR